MRHLALLQHFDVGTIERCSSRTDAMIAKHIGHIDPMQCKAWHIN